MTDNIYGSHSFCIVTMYTNARQDVLMMAKSNGYSISKKFEVRSRFLVLVLRIR